MKAELLTLGAESQIFRVEQWGRILIMKIRPKKLYLLNEIDRLLRASRTNRECKMLTEARSLGVPTPAVHSVDIKNYSIIMDFIEGIRFKEKIKDLGRNQIQENCEAFGKLIALLHRNDIVHGDPTTSNLIIDNSRKLWMIDFGLSEKNATIEMKGVDLHLIQRTYETTHWEKQDFMLEATIEGYVSALKDDAEAVLRRMGEIRERGRYH